jgi:hypothetical protein
MRKPHYLCVALLALTVIATGCQSAKTGRTKQRYQDNAGSFTDLSARTEYIDRRVADLTEKGVDRDTAAARASREWFAQAPVASKVPTAYELKRREAQAEFTTYLDTRKEGGVR